MLFDIADAFLQHIEMIDEKIEKPREKQVASKAVMLGMLQASSEACWCMEFGQPVDVTAPDAEVVRQVFENDPYWSFANQAMAQLYLMPEGEFAERPVSEIFPQNRQNEEFVLNLIANGFEVDAAPALDTRYDGVEIEVENDVRAHIENGRLLRMFGNVRDVGKHKRRESALQDQLDVALAMLQSVPTPVIAFGPSGVIVGVNRAALRVLNETSENIIGQPVRQVLADSGDQLAAQIDRPDALSPEQSGFISFGHQWTVSPGSPSGAVAGILTAISQATPG